MGKRMPISEPKGQREDLSERRAQVMALRKAGGSIRAIAAQLGMPPTVVYEDLQHTLKELAAETMHDTREYRAMEMARLDDMLLVLSPQLKAGHLGAIDRALRISERRARLLGLDTAASAYQTNTTLVLTPQQLAGLSDEELHAYIARLAGFGTGPGGGGTS